MLLVDWRCASERARAEANEPRAKGSADRQPRLPAEGRKTRRIELGDANVFGARSLGTLALFERHGLPLTQVVEPGAGAGRVVAEVLVAVARKDKTETLVADEPLDRAVRRCHCASLLETCAHELICAGRGVSRRSGPRLKAGSACESWLA